MRPVLLACSVGAQVLNGKFPTLSEFLEEYNHDYKQGKWWVRAQASSTSLHNTLSPAFHPSDFSLSHNSAAKFAKKNTSFEQNLKNCHRICTAISGVPTSRHILTLVA